MKVLNIVLVALVVVVGGGFAYYFSTMEMPVAATEEGEAGHADEAGEKEHEHTGEEEHAEEGEKHDDHGEEPHEEGGTDEHGDEDGAQHAKIDEATAEKHGLKFAPAVGGVLQNRLTLPGEIALDENRVVHVVPRLSGVAEQVAKNLGDMVAKGDLLAKINSRELADLKSDYLASLERRSLAQSRFAREKELFEKKISPAEDFLSAKQALAEEDIMIRTSDQKLQALGLSTEAIASVRDRSDRSLTDYSLISPLDGTVIEKHLTTGEFVEAQADAFVIADLSQVWVSVVVYAADLKNIRDGQQVIVRSEDLGIEATGEVAYIGALVGEQTRTTKATVELPNPEGLWRPGLFVSVGITQDEFSVPIAVALDAVQSLKDESVVFVREGDTIESRPVKLGRSDGKQAEILEGLNPGEMYVTENSFLVKADIEKAGAAHEH
ncbi:MAG: efflux RND transporter periplasmic adaptor subunit [Candidatus Hydrogenedentes bacterium]|nr:efflux RND transporter periplasmic adaptor subunit [Candidatus Hydrogenedentota bacterium]